MASTAPALILIDWQKGFRDHRHFGGERNNPDADYNAGLLLASWRERGWPVCHVAHDSSEVDSPLAAGKPGNAFETFALPRDNEPVYRKSVNSCFFGTQLGADLGAGNVDTLVFCGLTTDHCVSTSVRMAANLGFTVMLASDACATFPRGLPGSEKFPADVIHWTALASLSGEFALIAPTDFIVEQKEGAFATG